MSMNIWFASDHHLGHENIRKADYADRPFDSVDEMNEALVEAHNAKVAPGDLVYFLGDVAMGKIAESLPLVARMNGRKTLILGNHDRPFHAHGKKLERWMAEYSLYFTHIFTDSVVNFDGHDVLLNHFPYHGDSHGFEDRYADLRPPDEGQWLLHGHVHSKEFVHGGNMIHVGVDSEVAAYGPINFETIREAMR